LLLVQCAPEDVVVADLPPRPDGGGRDPERCVENDDCHDPAAFCAKDTCTSLTGRCELRPAFCDNARGITCGCDRVNYWNDCLRRQAGTAASIPGECTPDAARCGGPSSTACPVSGASCARFVPERAPCAPEGMLGVCWVLPTTCPADDGRPVQACAGGPGSPCVDRCDAIRTEKVHHETTPMMCH
jgi:hypothetical protein